jgi:hypothetical protein
MTALLIAVHADSRFGELVWYCSKRRVHPKFSECSGAILDWFLSSTSDDFRGFRSHSRTLCQSGYWCVTVISSFDDCRSDTVQVYMWGSRKNAALCTF